MGLVIVVNSDSTGTATIVSTVRAVTDGGVKTLVVVAIAFAAIPRNDLACPWRGSHSGLRRASSPKV